MKPITCLIVDDEPLARKGMAGYVLQVPILQLAGLCEDVTTLEAAMAKERIDLLFLDIEMPGLSGIGFLRQAVNPPPVIFTSAYERYALQGFELGVLDYLLKPVSFAQFSAACQRVQDYFSAAAAETPEFLFVKTGQRLEKVWFAEVLFIEALENYVSIVTPEKKMMVHSTLKAMQEKFPASRFVQVHKSYLVNERKIDAVEGNLLHLGRFTIPVSKSAKDDVMKRILRNG